MATQDAFLRMMNAQDVSGASTKVSTAVNVGSSGADADHGLNAFFHGFGAISTKQLRLKIVVTTAITLLTDMTFALRQGSDDPLTADLVTLSSTTVALADLGINAVAVDIVLPEITDQFIDILVSHTGTNPGAGNVSAFIQLGSARGHGL